MPLLAIRTDDSLHEVFGVGRGSDGFENLKDKAAAWLFGRNLPLTVTLETETLKQLLAAEFDKNGQPYQNAAFSFPDDVLTVTDHSDGQSFHWDTVLADVNSRLQRFEPINLTLALTADPAPITTSLAQAALPTAEQILALAPLTLTYEDKTFAIERADLANWLALVPNNGSARVILTDEAIDASLEPIAGEIDIPVQEGRFSLNLVDDEVQLKQFQEGQNGLAVQTAKTIATIQTAVLTEQRNTIPLVVEITEPRATPENLADLGIKELLGTGETNFAGSPYNRIQNIAMGADRLNGLLIAPDETFSLLSVLSPIDLEHGWLSELVIKGDKLEKEAGGGLCQIGTTSFRAAMMSGLPIVERRNHSWAVSYYNYNGKAGVDATIYEPSPDFKFKNDTGNYILWRSRIEGSNIYFELWGTADGRKGYFTEPVNYGYVSPGATEEVVDPSLPPGTRNCVQHAYTGVSASFDYIIERPDGSKDTQNFTSVYRARPARCLIGPTAEAEPTTTATETTEEDADVNNSTEQPTAETTNQSQPDNSQPSKKKKN